MKLELEINRQWIEAEFTMAKETISIRLNGKTHQADVSQPEPGLYTVMFNDRVFACALERTPAGAIEIVVNGNRIPVTVRDKKQMRGGASAGSAAGGRAVLVSPMPGKVVRVLVKAGDEVLENQGLLVVEAMKMQNEVQAPRTGKVAEIKVTEGQTVNAGETLAVIE